MNRRFALFAVAFLVALAGTGAVFTYVSRVDARAVAGQQPVQVLVASEKIPAGATAGSLEADGLVELKQLARNSVPADALKDVTGREAQVALSDIDPGEVLLAAKFASEAGPNSGALTIPEGQLAVSVSLEDRRGVGGFVTPGAEVAVFDTFNTAPDADGGATPSGDRLTDSYPQNRATRLLLGRVTVLAVDREVTPETGAVEDPATAAQAPDIVLTLAVSQVDTERLIHAAETGSLWFALLSGTSKTAPSEGVDNLRLFTQDQT